MPSPWFGHRDTKSCTVTQEAGTKGLLGQENPPESPQNARKVSPAGTKGQENPPESPKLTGSVPAGRAEGWSCRERLQGHSKFKNSPSNSLIYGLMGPGTPHRHRHREGLGTEKPQKIPRGGSGPNGHEPRWPQPQWSQHPMATTPDGHSPNGHRTQWSQYTMATAPKSHNPQRPQP